MNWFDWLIHLWRPRPRPAPPAPPPPPPSPSPSDGLASINAARAAYGLAPLAPHPALLGSSQAWADRMAQSGILSHGDFAGRLARVLPGVAAAENIAEGQPDAASVVAAWMSDPPHRRNILGDYTHAGLAQARDARGRPWWCLDLARLEGR